MDAMPLDIGVAKVVALIIALAKLHIFCIGESNVPEHVPQMLDRDRFHMMNVDSGYVRLFNDDLQQNTAVPIDLIHLGEHFEDVPDNLLHLHCRRSVGIDLPWTHLFQMIVDGHWQRLARLGNKHR